MRYYCIQVIYFDKLFSLLPCLKDLLKSVNVESSLNFVIYVKFNYECIFVHNVKTINFHSDNTYMYFKGLLQIYHIKEMKGANLLLNYAAFYFKFQSIKKGTDNLFIVISVIS